MTNSFPLFASVRKALNNQQIKFKPRNKSFNNPERLMTENYPSSVLDYIIHIITIGPFKPHLLLQKYISAFD